MARKTGQIIRRGPQMRMVRIYVGRDPETRKRNYIGKSIHGGLRAAQTHLNRMLAERTSAATFAPRGKPSASTSITGSTSAPGRGCGPRASATTRPCSQGTSVHDWAQDHSGSFRRPKSKRSTANC